MTGEDEVDWDAVFRTIDHQQGPGSVARPQGRSGTRTVAEEGLFARSTDWAVHGRDSGLSGRPQSKEGTLLEQFSRHLQEQATAQASSSRTGRTGEDHVGRPDPTAGLSSYGHTQAALSISGEDDNAHDLPFRAMLQAMSNGQALPIIPEPAPAQRSVSSGRRRRSHSLGPRRSASDVDTMGQLPLFTAQPNHNLSDHFPFASSASTSTPAPRLPPTGPLSTDFLDFLTQGPHSFQTPHTQQPYASTTTTPAPTPLQTFTPFPSLAPDRAPLSARSSLATPLHSPHLNDPTPPSTGHSGPAPTPGAEADSEDKRVRNTLASARFRAKRKAHLAEVEQQITELEGRSTTLRRQVEDLKKENHFLKEMVQLKYGLDVDKRM